jgi:hypothetical protein
MEHFVATRKKFTKHGFILGVSSRVEGSKVQGSGFWIQKFQDLSARFRAALRSGFHQTSDL